MKKIIQFLTSKIIYLIYLYILIQLILIFSTNIEFQRDALYYYNLAQECLNGNEFYPAKQHLHEDYIFAPLYINVLILLLKLYNAILTVALFNILISLLQILILYKITERLFSGNVVKVTILLYMLYLNTLGLVLSNYTELFFLLLISYSILLYLQNKNYSPILSGFVLGGAIAVRPAGWALFIAFMILHIYKGYKTRKLVPSYFYIYLGVFVFILSYGSWTYSHFGKFIFTSTTGPVNVLLGANDDATGGFNSIVYEKGKAGYIEYPDSLTYIQKGEFYQDQAITWIKENPLRWLTLAPLKLVHAFGWDDIAISSLFGFNDVNFARVIRILLLEKDIDKALPNTTLFTKLIYFLILILHHIFYYLLLITIVLGIYSLLKNRKSNDGINLILVFSLLSVLILIITVGSPRYKYPLFILLLPFAAYYIQAKLDNKVPVADNE